MNDMLKRAERILPDIIKWRRHIHENAELSFCEHGTAGYIASVLDSFGISYRSVAGTGILARVDGAVADPVRPVVLRADIDALPIHENTGLEYASRNGAMHACGHDIHSAALLGALALLRENASDFKGTVLGLFQPGEELHPGGASKVLGEGIFDGMQPRAFLGQHVSPELEVGTFGFHCGTFMASSDEVHIIVRGRGGHSAQPYLLADPVVASAAIITALQQVVSRNGDAMTPSVLSIGRVIADGATNVIPDEVYMNGTFRTMGEEWRAAAKMRIREIAENTAKAYGVGTVVDIRDGYPCVYNDPQLTEIAAEAARKEFGERSAVMIDRRMTAEDFGFYSALYPSVFYRLGVGPTAPLHNAAFDPDERSLAYGTAMMATLALRFMK